MANVSLPLRPSSHPRAGSLQSLGREAVGLHELRSHLRRGEQGCWVANMKRIAAIGLAGLIAVPAAAAQPPAPTMVRFHAGDPPGLSVATLMQTSAACTGQPVFGDTVPVSAPTFLFAPCRPTLRL